MIRLRSAYLRKIWGHDVDPTARVSFSSFLDKTCPQNITIGEYTIITRGCVIMSHDFTRALSLKTIIGKNCLIGVNAIILPGVNIGNEVIVGAGSVVTKDVPSNTLVAGNPAIVIRDIRTDKYGKIIKGN